MNPIFLTREEILFEQDYLIKRYGGEPGILNSSALDSALHTPQQTFEGKYLHEEIIAMASAYLSSFVNNHAFVDGNKRIGTYAALAFLALNNVDVICDPDDMADLTIGVVEGKISKEEVAEFLKEQVGKKN